MLRSLGVAGDSDGGLTLVESLDELVGEVVDDLYLARFGHQKELPVITREQALAMAREVVANPHTLLTPVAPAPGSTEAVRVELATAVLTELERRKRRLGILGYDDLLTRLATALEDDDAPARSRMHGRWRIVMIDEFQDTDPVQWEVIEAAFVGHATVVLIGDPSRPSTRSGAVTSPPISGQPERADRQWTLGTNWRSDRLPRRAAADPSCAVPPSATRTSWSVTSRRGSRSHRLVRRAPQ